MAGAETIDGHFEKTEFNKNIPINEAEKITNLKNSVGMISDETILAEHPYVDDPAIEAERLEKKRAEQQAFIESQMANNNEGDDDE